MDLIKRRDKNLKTRSLKRLIGVSKKVVDSLKGCDSDELEVVIVDEDEDDWIAEFDVFDPRFQDQYWS